MQIGSLRANGQVRRADLRKVHRYHPWAKRVLKGVHARLRRVWTRVNALSFPRVPITAKIIWIAGTPVRLRASSTR